MANLLKSKLTRISPTDIRDKNGKKKAEYRCECGTVKECYIDNVKRGKSLSCGCLSGQQHRLRWTPIYGVWCGMKARCCNENCPSYPQYGGRGVKICDEWLNDFKSFYDWCMANGWKKGLKVDKDKIGNGQLYSPNTCCILTNKENCNYTRMSRVIEHDGVKKNVQQWSEHFHVQVWTFRHRMKISNWNIGEYLENSNKWRKVKIV